MIPIRIYPPPTHVNSNGYSSPLTSLPSPPTNMDTKQESLPDSYDPRMNPAPSLHYLTMK